MGRTSSRNLPSLRIAASNAKAFVKVKSQQKGIHMLRNRLTLTGLAIAILATSAALPVSAADMVKPQDHVVAATQPAADPKATAIPTLSQEGFATLRAVRAARVALFNGDSDLAKQMVQTAQADLALVTVDAAKPGQVITLAASPNGKATAQPYVAIDGSIMLADNFVATPDKDKAIKTANTHMQGGEHGKALETLRLASVDVSFARVLMPVTATATHLEAASKLFADGKYYEGNIALKAIEDGIVTDTVSISG
jgi:YfdX protein